jgi:hypothetical protein
MDCKIAINSRLKNHNLIRRLETVEGKLESKLGEGDLRQNSSSDKHEMRVTKTLIASWPKVLTIGGVLSA